MHSQKKRRKRTLEGEIEIDEISLTWELINEPLWSTDHGYKGVCIRVRAEAEGQRELIIEYPYPSNKHGSPLPLPQRPNISDKMIEAEIRKALISGWKPASRGKVFIYRVPSISN